MPDLPTHKSEQTGNAGLDRIQNNVRDMITYLRSILWMTKRAYVALATDATTSSATYAALLATTFTSVNENSFLVVQFTVSGVKVTNNGNVAFRVVVDGVATKGITTYGAIGAAGIVGTILLRVAVTRGLHAIRVDWLTTTVSARISAATVVEEHASLHVCEEAA